MMNNENISDELLNAFIDNELESDEKSEMLDSVVRNDVLKVRVCELRSLKEMVQHAYHRPPANKVSAISNTRSIRRSYVHNLQRLAACVLLLMLGGVSGWVIATNSESKGDSYVAYVSKATSIKSASTEQGNIIFQVSNSNPIRLKAALDEAESLLEASRSAHRQLNVEFVANADGVNLLRSDISPYAKRIGIMKAKYPNLDFLACSQTISNLRKNGVTVHLLPNTGIAVSAADEINKRLHQGWDYARM